MAGAAPGRAHKAAVASREAEILAAKRALDSRKPQPPDLATGYYRVCKLGRWRVGRWVATENRWLEPSGNERPAGFFDEIGERVG